MAEKILFKAELGDPMSRVEGRQKVTGAAKYAAEYSIPNMAHGVLVTSTIAKGHITALDTKAAEAAPGVLAVVSHLNSPEVPGFGKQDNTERARVYGEEFKLFHTNQIYHNHQPIALVVADTLEQANYASRLVKVQYTQQDHHTSLEANKQMAEKPAREEDYRRGQANAYAAAPVKVELTYETPIQVHNPMETHAATAVWHSPDKVTVYNKTQAVKISQKEIMRFFNLKEENVHVISPFVGGAFGSSSRVWPPELAAILGAKKTGRPVKVMARRDQVFNMVGWRPRSLQKVGLGTTPDGQLVGITHEAIGESSQYEQFTERVVVPTKAMYSCPNLNTVYRIVPLDVSTPCWTRAPGEASGSFALESAMDELAEKLTMDPLDLRLKNFAERDEEKNLPWSSNHLRECYERGAEKFGWNQRTPAPRSMRQGDWLIGWGMSAGIYKSDRSTAAASALLRPDGTFLVQSSVADVGPGSATIFTQIAAEALGVEPERVTFGWGNSDFPLAPGQFGSHTTASVGTAVHEVCTDLVHRLRDLAMRNGNAAFKQAKTDDFTFANGRLGLRNGKADVSYADLLKQNNLPELKLTKETKPGPEKDQYSGKSFCANFVEVQVQAQTGQVKVNRVVCAIDAGKIMNHKTAESQVYGSIAWGLGLALMEEAVIDHRFGRHVNNDLAHYHVPVHADIPQIEVLFTDKADGHIDPMGAKGLGEIGMVGFAAAVANAVYHATGKRVRNLPITPDKLV